MARESEGTEALAVALRVRQLMDKHGVPKRSQASVLSRILDLSFSAASRKMKGQLPWDLKQLGAVAGYFGEAASVLLTPEDESAGSLAVEGMLMVSPRALPCIIHMGDEAAGPSPLDLVALEIGGAWRAYPAEIAPPGKARSVFSLEVRPLTAQAEKPMIAVVDDDTDTNEADNVCEYLNGHGLQAQAFYDLATFREQLKNTAYDAFVLDWLVNNETVEEVIGEIRRSDNGSAPIFLLTGQLRTGKAHVDEIAFVIQRFGCKWIEKPIRMPILLSEITHELSRTGPQGADPIHSFQSRVRTLD